MKKKILMMSILLLNCLIMWFPWFKTMDGNRNIHGLIMLKNPIALTCLILCFIGIWIKHQYSEIFETIGCIGMMTMQIYEFLTWHIRISGGSIDFQLSCQLTYSYFYLAVFISMISYIIYKFILGRLKFEQEYIVYV